MSWTQVYVTGLSQTASPSDEDLEGLLDGWYDLSSDSDLLWAGPGTTLVKRDKDSGVCRGFAFLAFFSMQGASIAVDRINNGVPRGDTRGVQLQAELSKPKTKTKKAPAGQPGADHSDIRLRHKRKAPVRKHPVLVSSDKKRTGLGNKTV
jgi:hypothetical protein